MLTLADALEAITTFRPQAVSVITEAVIDSRQTIPGSLFVAIPGEKVDGHDFIGEAFKRGASFALIQRDAGADASYRTLDLRSVSSTDSYLGIEPGVVPEDTATGTVSEIQESEPTSPEIPPEEHGA